ncbi:MAG: tetratricopeptide repeat protein [Agrobacterium tumefaciens]|nr:tetratricopeptide repeat protein [Agrobacterium tumefaciens]
MIEKLMKVLESGRDSAVLRFSIAKALVEARQFEHAAQHLQEAIRQNPDYSAVWAELGECRARLGDNDGAAAAWVEGVAVAIRCGDIQAKRQMEVRLRRLQTRSSNVS